MPARVGGGDPGDGVEAAEKGCGGGDMGGPLRVGAAGAVSAVNGGSGGAGVGGLKTVDGGGLDL